MKSGRNGEIKFANNKNWLIKELNKPRSKRLISAYIGMLINGEIDYKKLGNIYRQDEKIPEATVKRLLKYKETQDMINQELQKALNNNNVTYDSVIKERLSILEDAKKPDPDLKTKDALSIRLDTIKGFETILQMDSPIKETKQLTQSFNYKELLENGEKRDITLSQTKEIDDNSIQENE